jgi:hypothetical protein
MLGLTLALLILGSLAWAQAPPPLYCSLEWLNLGGGNFGLRNTGNGVAHNVTVTRTMNVYGGSVISGGSGGVAVRQETVFSHHRLLPGEYVLVPYFGGSAMPSYQSCGPA